MRLRFGSGYGQYHYDTLPPARGDCRYGFGDGRTRRIEGKASFIDILAGYQATIGGTVAKAFAGIAIDDQELSPADICNPTAGRAQGVKLAAETWTELTPAIWLALDGSWSSAHGAYSARSRLGFRVLPRLSLGLEDGVAGSTGGYLLRSGVFARYDWSGGEVSLSGGLASDRLDFRGATRDDAWAAVSVLFRY